MKTLNRRKFFDKITKGAIGVALINSLPLSLFAKTKKNVVSNVRISIHNNAVKRNNRIVKNV